MYLNFHKLMWHVWFLRVRKDGWCWVLRMAINIRCCSTAVSSLSIPCRWHRHLMCFVEHSKHSVVSCCTSSSVLEMWDQFLRFHVRLHNNSVRSFTRGCLFYSSFRDVSHFEGLVFCFCSCWGVIDRSCILHFFSLSSSSQHRFLCETAIINQHNWPWSVMYFTGSPQLEAHATNRTTPLGSAYLRGLSDEYRAPPQATCDYIANRFWATIRVSTSELRTTR